MPRAVFRPLLIFWASSNGIFPSSSLAPIFGVSVSTIGTGRLVSPEVTTGVSTSLAAEVVAATVVVVDALLEVVLAVLSSIITSGNSGSF